MPRYPRGSRDRRPAGGAARPTRCDTPARRRFETRPLGMAQRTLTTSDRVRNRPQRRCTSQRSLRRGWRSLPRSSGCVTALRRRRRSGDGMLSSRFESVPMFATGYRGLRFHPTCDSYSRGVASSRRRSAHVVPELGLKQRPVEVLRARGFRRPRPVRIATTPVISAVEAAVVWTVRLGPKCERKRTQDDDRRCPADQPRTYRASGRRTRGWCRVVVAGLHGRQGTRGYAHRARARGPPQS